MTYSFRTGFLTVALFSVAVLLSGCAGELYTPNPIAEGTYPVATEFNAYYAERGGLEVLGPAISQSITKDGLLIQYTQSALMVMNPLTEGGRSYSLAPLGVRLGYSEPASALADANAPQIAGYLSDPVLMYAYNTLGGEAVLGKPLTNRLINGNYDRVEQHFENMGLAYWLNEPNGQVIILPYGATACGQPCSEYVIPENMGIATAPALPREIEALAGRFGLGLRGDFLAGPFDLTNGGKEVIYEGIVLYTSPENPGRAQVRELSLMVGIQPDKPVSPLNSPYVVFFAVADGRGFNIPLFFYDFLMANGGLDASGDPITEVAPYKNDIYQQCFENLCLLFDENAPSGMEITVRPLGLEYRTLFHGAETAEPAVDNVTLHVWEDRSPVTSQDSQTLYVIVRADGQPLAGVQPRLTVFLPDGSMRAEVFPPTNELGESAFIVGPVAGANGSWINYDVCFKYPGDEVCVAEQYFLWGNP